MCTVLELLLLIVMLVYYILLYIDVDMETFYVCLRFRYDCFECLTQFRYPWGQEAFEKAKSENKVIFLSGNSCQYCILYNSGIPCP